jgi:hypothetical protein
VPPAATKGKGKKEMKRRLEFDDSDSASWCFGGTFASLFLAMLLYCAIIGLGHANLNDESDAIARAKIKVEEGSASISEKVLAQKTPPQPKPPPLYNPTDHPYLAISIGLLALAFISFVWADNLTLREVKEDKSKDLKAAKERIAELEEALRGYRFLSGDLSESEPPSAISRN